MKQFLDGDTLYSEILMMRQVDDRVILLVEGEEDTALIDPHIDDASCRSQIGYGKVAVLQAAKLCRINSIDRVFAAVDRDFDCEDEIHAHSNAISLSENYDLHVDVLVTCSDCIKRVITAHAQKDRVRSYLERYNATAADLVLSITGHVGALRRASVRCDMGLSMDKFPTASLIEAFETDNLVNEVVRLALARSKFCPLDKEYVSGILETEIADANFASVASGHDVVSVLSALIRTRWGGSTGSDALGRALRSSVDWECFQRLRICTDFREWGHKSGRKIWERDNISAA